ncbi:MAG: tRNA (adenosine(37)-N6)-threonylcarbamoyltransferase complex ATPase subunit type 1 TsaE [Caldiserica bacterium]|nr:tRNA (adenosine(37)-N6)-threonylcarbamoyltransferase complex ATPase subunit type 1 TsaE [Caldisericota bacterium]
MESLSRRCITHSPQETIYLGEKLGRYLEGGEFILLQGPLGVGKTVFVKGIARGLQVPTSVYVRSPSFTLLHIYQGKVPLYHFDLFRMKQVEDLASIGWEEYLTGEGVVVVEWGDKFPSCMPSYLSVKLDFAEEENDREILLQSSDKKYISLIKRMFP